MYPPAVITLSRDASVSRWGERLAGRPVRGQEPFLCRNFISEHGWETKSVLSQRMRKRGRISGRVHDSVLPFPPASFVLYSADSSFCPKPLQYFIVPWPLRWSAGWAALEQSRKKLRRCPTRLWLVSPLHSC